VIEKYFGGLDKLCHNHHTIGKLAFFALLIYPVVLAVRWLPDNIAKTFWYLLPVHSKLEINLGSWALIGLCVLLLFTLVIKLPYDKWKITHKFMGLLFVLGIAHVFGVAGFYEENPLLSIYFIIISILAVAAFMYKAIFRKWAAKKHPFTVVKIDKLDERTMEITFGMNLLISNLFPGNFVSSNL